MPFFYHNDKMFTYSPIHSYIHRVKLDELSEYAITVVKPLLSEKRLKDFLNFSHWRPTFYVIAEAKEQDVKQENSATKWLVMKKHTFYTYI